MFDQNDQNQQAAATTAPVAADPAAPAGITPVADLSAPALPASDPVADPAASASDNGGQDFNVTPLGGDPAPATDTSASAANLSVPADPAPAVGPSAPASNDLPADTNDNANSDSSDLLSIKQDALQSLSPLLSHLDQSPEEKFRTTMMLIQASDDQSLIQTAYAAAKEIGDEKVRAQALLDIVNEINYFTQSKPTA
jgi:hypothetical protein